MLRKRKLHAGRDRPSERAVLSARQRIAALEIIRGTTNDSIYVQRRFPKAYRILRKGNSGYEVIKSGSCLIYSNPRRSKSPSSRPR
jgi:hypothetical protein